MPLMLDEEYAVAVMAEVNQRGGPKETGRWRSDYRWGPIGQLAEDHLVLSPA